MRKFAVTTGATNVEVLAGAGEVEKARELAQRILLLDGSPGAQSLLRQHLDRAGRPEILDRILQTP
jgi:bacterioferritin (cytochrome b1)